MKPLWIELVNDGVANRFSFKDYELIEINWRLTETPILYKRILIHELNHKEGYFKYEDLTHNLKSTCPGLFKFMFHNPSTWIQLLPLYYSKRKKAFVYDWSAITSWLMVFSIGICTYWLLGGLL